MSKCKKIICLIITLIVIMPINVYANIANEIKIDTDKTSVEVGDYVEITITAKCESGIEGIDSTLVYDESKLKLINEDEIALTGFTSMSGKDEETGEYKLSVLYTGNEDVPTEAEFAKVKFEVLNKVKKDKNLNIKIEEIEIGDSNGEWIELEEKQIILTVENAQSNSLGRVIKYIAIAIVVVILLFIIFKKSKNKKNGSKK